MNRFVDTEVKAMKFGEGPAGKRLLACGAILVGLIPALAYSTLRNVGTMFESLLRGCVWRDKMSQVDIEEEK